MKADLFETDFSQATVITIFLLPDINLKLRPKILDLKPGTRIVSNTFTMEAWAADEVATVGEGCSSWCTALFWLVPAKVAGTWTLPNGELTLTQEFQMVSGSLRQGTETLPVSEGRLRGADLTFTVGGVVRTATVNGATMEGTTAAGAKWSATRAAK
jgi:hypothetical protein